MYTATSLLIQTKASKTFLPQAKTKGQDSWSFLWPCQLTALDIEHKLSKEKINEYTESTSGTAVMQIYKMSYSEEA